MLKVEEQYAGCTAQRLLKATLLQIGAAAGCACVWLLRRVSRQKAVAAEMPFAAAAPAPAAAAAAPADDDDDSNEPV